MKAKRSYLSASDLRALLEKQHGICAAPGCNSEGPFEADHYTCVALGNASKPDQLLCIDCHAAKTKRDVKAIAKVKRLSGVTSSQWSRREQNGSRLQSRGFTQWRGLSRTDIRSKGQ